MKSTKYIILVNGIRKYKDPMTLRKANLKAEWLRNQGYKLVKIVEARD